jgi:hypothetical protein
MAGAASRSGRDGPQCRRSGIAAAALFQRQAAIGLLQGHVLDVAPLQSRRFQRAQRGQGAEPAGHAAQARRGRYVIGCVHHRIDQEYGVGSGMAPVSA